MKRCCYHVIVFCLLCCAGGLRAQIVSTPSAGCVPLSVQFSGPSGATGVFWNLGNGMGTSTVTSPNPLYTSPGTYAITYTAIVNGSPVNYSYSLKVSPKPTGSFQFQQPLTHCVPMTVSMTCSGGNPGSTYNWAFGDLSPVLSSTLTSQTHTYSYKGVFTPVMTILDAVTGCTNTATNNSGTIALSNPPTLSITSSDGWIGCSPPFTTNISGLGTKSGSPLGPLLYYNWTFNTGTPPGSNQMNPGMVSFGQGSHTVTLVCTDDNNCSTTMTVPVFVGTPSLSMSVPSVICKGDAWGITNIFGNNPNLVIQCTPQVTTVAGVNSTNASSVQMLPIQTTTGNIVVTATLFTPPGCTPVVQSYTVFVEELYPDFTVPATTVICSPTTVISFTNLTYSNYSLSTLSYTWGANGADQSYDMILPATPYATTSSTFVPTFTLYQNSKNPYVIYEPFIADFSLHVTSSEGCAMTRIKAPIIIQRISPWFTVNKREGCATFTLMMRDSTITNGANPISSYTFCNGASPPTFTPGFNYNGKKTAIFTYSGAGTYSPYIIVQTSTGCLDTSFFENIIMVDPPPITASFAPSPSICVGQTLQVTMTGTPMSVPGSSVIQHWSVLGDAGFYSNCMSDATPTYSMTHVGVHQFTVTGYQSSCPSSTVIPQTITVHGPAGDFIYRTNCETNRFSVDFDVHLMEVATATLDYGDGGIPVIISTGGTDDYAITLTHTYAATGNFNASLTVASSVYTCGPNSYTQTVKIRNAQAHILYNGKPIPPLPGAMACVKDPYNFTATASIDPYACSFGAKWTLVRPDGEMLPFDAGIGTPVQLSFHKPPPDTTIYDRPTLDTFRVAGIYTVSLNIRDENNCASTDLVQFRISNAVPAFTLTPNPFCLSDNPLKVKNGTQQTQLYGDTMAAYTWSVFSPVMSSEDTVLHVSQKSYSPSIYFKTVLPPSGIFTISCYGINSVGCDGTTTKTIQVNNPYPNFVTSDYYPCVGIGSPKTLTFYAKQGLATYSVNYDDPPPGNWITSSTFPTGTHSYSMPGIYHPTMTVVDAQGCKSSQVATITAIGQPTAKITFGNNINHFCIPATATMISNSSFFVDSITNYIWTVGSVTNPPPGNDTLTDIFTTPGVINLTLTVDSRGFCPNSATASVYVYERPQAKANIDKPVFCLGDDIHVFLSDTDGVYNWRWFFGDNKKQDSIYSGSFLATQNKTLTYNYSTFPTTGKNGFTNISLLYYSPGFACYTVATVSIQVIDVKADFHEKDDIYAHCFKLKDEFIDLTPNPTSQRFNYSWEIDKNSFSGQDQIYTFPAPGVYPVKLTVTDADYGCRGSAVKQVTVFPLPTGQFDVSERACPGASFTITGRGDLPGANTLTVTVEPGNGPFPTMAGNAFSYTYSTMASTHFTMTVQDSNKCFSPFYVDSIYIQEAPPVVNWDTTIIIGQSVTLNAYNKLASGYLWQPEITGLNCNICDMPNPISSTSVSITYSVSVSDNLNCSTVRSTYHINVLPLTTLDVPSAFTPNGDGVNDVIKLGGWGIKNVKFFRIYNRWGQIVFSTNDVNQGWDGNFQGVPQNMETYVYQAEVDTYIGTSISKSGTIKLIR